MCNKNETNEISEVMRKNGFDSDGHFRCNVNTTFEGKL